MRWPTRVLRAARIGIPVALLGVGVMLLVGCIYIPATYQYQTNGKLRPESLVGRDKAIDPGRTTLVEALIALNRHASGHASRPSSLWPTGFLAPAIGPIFSRDRRSVASSYRIRTGTWLYPLCFNSTEDAETRWIVLDLDENDIVQATHTYAALPTESFGLERHQAAAMIFREKLSVEQRTQLAEAGVIPTDAQIEAWVARGRVAAAQVAEAQARRSASTNPTSAPPTKP